MCTSAVPEPLLTVRNLHAYYGNAHVLFDVTLELRAGSLLALLGRNGAGKSTLVKSIAGIEARTQGRIVFAGRDVAGLPAHRRAQLGMQLVPEERRIYAELSVRENLALGRHAAGDRAPLGLTELTDLFPLLSDLLKRRGAALSGGEQQVVAVARALVAQPTCLMLDEPTEGLAPLIVEQIGAAIAGLRARYGTTVLLVEQNATFALGLADDVVVLDEGRAVFSGSAAAFRADPAHARDFLTLS